MKLFIGLKQKMPEALCIGCGAKLTTASTVNSRDLRPREGDRTICCMCGYPMAFNADLSLRSLTDIEVVEMARDDRVVSLQIARLRKML